MVRALPRPTRRSPLTIIRVLLDVALVAVVGFGLSGVVLGRLVPALGHPVYVVAGPSMEPTIHLGSAVVLTPVAPGSLAVDDIVSLRSGPSRAVFTHRIIDIADREGQVWVRTKGDANDGPDPAISPSVDVIGRVTAVVPYAGYALTLLSAPAGVALVLSLGATLMVLGWHLDGLALDRRDRRRAPAAPAAPVGAIAAGRAAGPLRRWFERAAMSVPPGGLVPAGGLALTVVGPAPGAAARAAAHLATLPASTAHRAGAAWPTIGPAAVPVTGTTVETVPAGPTTVVPGAARPGRARRPKAAPAARSTTSAPKRGRTRAARATS